MTWTGQFVEKCFHESVPAFEPRKLQKVPGRAQNWTREPETAGVGRGGAGAEGRGLRQGGRGAAWPRWPVAIVFKTSME